MDTEKAIMGMALIPKKTKLIPNKMAIPAPSEAPPETPIIKGSTKGFLNSPCNTIPETPKEAPAIIAKRTLGNLRLYKIKKLSSDKVFLSKISKYNSLKLISVEPFPKDQKIDINKIITKINNLKRYAFFTKNIYLLNKVVSIYISFNDKSRG